MGFGEHKYYSGKIPPVLLTKSSSPDSRKRNRDIRTYQDTNANLVQKFLTINISSMIVCLFNEQEKIQGGRSSQL